jgi:GNAT superfamily N-acetyltransferase
MDSGILMKPVETPEDEIAFWQAKYEFFLRDVFPNNDIGSPITEEDRAYFLSGEYRARIEALSSRDVDRAYSAFFERDGHRIGFCQYCTYLSEDGKCFVLDFCVFPDLRCQGLGMRCFAALQTAEETRGAKYFALNTHCRRSMRFWEHLGFRQDGFDEYGSALMVLPPRAEGHLGATEGAP